MDKDLTELQSEIETAIFEYERKTKETINKLEVLRVNELDFEIYVELAVPEIRV